MAPQPAKANGTTRRRENVRWQLEMTRARAGLASSMAVPKKVAQKARGRLKKTHEGHVPKVTEDVAQTLHSLALVQRNRRLHHATKLLGACVKKAKSFLVRKLVRKVKEEREQSGSKDCEERLAAVKKLPHMHVAHKMAQKALERQGNEWSRPAEDAVEEAKASAEWVELQLTHPGVCDAIESQLLSSAQVQVQFKQLLAQMEEPASARSSKGSTRAEAITGSAKQHANGATKRPRAEKAAGGNGKGNIARNQFITSLADGGDIDGDGDDISGEEGASLVFSGAAGIDEPQAGAKKKNFISRSGNRMGQRQRQALAERDAGGGLARGGARGGGRSSAGRGRGGRDGRSSGTTGGRSTAARGRGSGKPVGHAPNSGASGHHAPTKSAEGELHPSWAAKRSAHASIQPFQGKKITFD
mmetsp:Transcript_9268/g.20208  ORF Transcript_9268/g.20208 Transcript_9268/m.20208 type:complete len:415 (-) Transcript_9268:336-1580(-)